MSWRDDRRLAVKLAQNVVPGDRIVSPRRGVLYRVSEVSQSLPWDPEVWIMTPEAIEGADYVNNYWPTDAVTVLAQ